MEYTFTPSTRGVGHLEAPYALLVKAFGNDGTVSPRDDVKSMCEWDIDVLGEGTVEVYDYKVGTCYSTRGLAREDITVWHVQGSPKGIKWVLHLLAGAAR